MTTKGAQVPDKPATGSEHDASSKTSTSGPTPDGDGQLAEPSTVDSKAAADAKPAVENKADQDSKPAVETKASSHSKPDAEDEHGKSSHGWSSKLRHAALAYAHRISFAGLMFATVFLWLSTTPSLLPRGPLFQGVVSGGAAAVGYCVGVFIAWLVRYMLSRSQRWPSLKRNYWIALGVIALIGTVVMLYWYSRWQTEIRNLMGVENLTWTEYPIIAVFAVLVFVLLMVIGQAWASLVTWLVRQLRKIAPPRVAAVAGLLVVALLTVFILNGVVAKYSMKALNSTFASANDEVRPNTAPPTSGLRSGGPGSLVTWESLGREGRVIVSNGPDVAKLSEFNKQPAMEPIRAFVGLGSGDNLRANAQLAADELVRAGGLKRKVIAIGSTTGSVGSTRRSSTRSSTCTTATSRRWRCSIRICRAGSRSSSTRNVPARRVRHCSKLSTPRCASFPKRSVPSSSSSAKGHARAPWKMLPFVIPSAPSRSEVVLVSMQRRPAASCHRTS